MTHSRQYQSFVCGHPSLPLDQSGNRPAVSRRRFLEQSAALAATAAVLASGGAPAYAAEEKVLLSINSSETRPQRVRVAVEVGGQMKMNPTGKEVKYLPMSVTADLQFLQRRLPELENSPAVRLARHYAKAETKFNLKNNEFGNQLRDDRRLIVLQAEGDDGKLFSPLGPLTREEHDLVDVQGCGVLPELLLPGKELAVGETWELSTPAVVRLLSLEAVHKHDIVGKFDEIRDGIVILSLEGKASGAIGGISSEINLKAKINFDPQEKLLTWLAMSLTENRAIGHAQPGYEVTSRIRILTALADEAPELSETSLEKLPLTAGPGELLIAFRSEKGGFELVHDRRWTVMSEKYDSAVLRLIDRGELVSQCNIAKLKNFAKNEKLTLETFQTEVKTALQKQNAVIAEAAQSTTESGLTVLRLLVTGNAAEIPIQWTYYHVSDSEGRRASLVFTIDAKLVERYAHTDQEIISAFRLFDPPEEKGEPTPADDKEKTETARKPAFPAKK